MLLRIATWQTRICPLGDDGRGVIAAVLSSTVGVKNMCEAIKKDLEEDDRVRRHTAKVIAVIAVALGPEGVMRIARPVAASARLAARHTIAKAIGEITERQGVGVARVGGCWPRFRRVAPS